MSGADSNSQSHTEPIRISIMSQDGTRIIFSMRPHHKLIQAFRSYCQRKQLEIDTVRFLYDGQRVSSRNTVRSLNMKDGDQIEAMITQGGGGGGF